ncbi:hypothetical protein ABES25_19095 [Bacillus gobiensis]|uniref:hypothetical protein n=1 Tax=Bacillus gobiensis TaxID=1441095 RepID=UPI003D196255
MKKFVLSMSLMLLLAGCGTNEAAPEDQKNSDNQTENSENKTEDSEVSKSGTFTGLADEHTIAVEIDGEETTFQVDSELQEKAKGIEDGTSVEVKYVEADNGVLELKEIETK